MTDKYKNIHKNLWLVEDREGLEQAAKIVAGQRGRDGLPVTIHSTRMQLSDKYPCVVVLIKVDVAAIEVISVITDTTLAHCLREIEALPK
jgi:hypothetical protein